MSGQSPQPSNPQADYLAQLRTEAATLPEAERLDHEALIAELAGELALAESMQLEADEYIARAKRLVGGPEVLANNTKVQVDMDKIGWVAEQGVEEVPAQEVSAPGLDYLFVDLTGRHRVTEKLRENLQQQGEYAKLLEKVTKEGIPSQWNSIVTGKNQNGAISIGKRSMQQVDPDRSLNTTYPAYKMDAKGSNNRAIMLVLDRAPDNKPVIALAALYDHDDQAAIYNSLFLKPPKQKRQ